MRSVSRFVFPTSRTVSRFRRRTFPARIGKVSPLLLLPICLASGAVTSHAAPATEGENATPATPGTPADNPPGTTSQGREAVPQPVDETPDLGFKLGADVFYGFSNLAQARRFRDGFWIGFGPAFPSVVTGRYTGRDGSTAKLALGVGQLYNGSMPTLNQPVEAWVQRPVGKLSVTAGKFYVPFEVQEWQYETKWGVMLQRPSERGFDLSASLNQNGQTNALNTYFRAGKRLNPHATVGLSVATGRGISYGSTHNKGLGLDVSANYRNFELLTSYVGLRRQRAAENFDFGFAKLSYTGLGRLTPFLSRHQWRDRSGQQGNFRSTALGASFQLTPTLAFEGALATSPEQSVRWLEVHWTPEW